MIKNTAERNNGGYKCDPTTRDQTINQALESLIIYELGYGGYQSVIEPTRIVVITRIMNCVDQTTFTGTAEEMSLLVEACVLHAQTNVLNGVNVPESLKDHAIDQVMVFTKGVPLLIKLGSGMITGRLNIKLILTLMTLCEDETLIKHFMQLDRDTQLAIVCLIRLDGATMEEALSLTGQPYYDLTGKIAGIEPTPYVIAV